MARQPDIQYVRFYTSGSAARKIEVQPEKRPVQPRPRTRKRVRRDNRILIRIDPISLCATVVAAVMLIAMAVGVLELGRVNQEMNRMESYVSTLSAENAQLQAEYEAGYDLEDIRQQALDMGLVPREDVEHITVTVTPPQVESQPQRNGWQRFWDSFRELFA